jgi:hypothetical protein
MKAILKCQFELHRNIEIQDVYKLLYQAALGSEHALSDPGMSFLKLTNEIVALKIGSKEHIVEPISPHNDLVRINLRPYVHYGGNLKILNEKFYQTAKEFKGNIEDLKIYWQEFKEFVTDSSGGFKQKDIDLYLESMKNAGYPSVHHSKNYKIVNDPAYRVVLLDLIYEEINRLGQISIPANFLRT